MAWVIQRRGALKYAGRLPRPRSFDRWAEAEGRAVVAAVASKRWFALFGKRRAAKREIWRELQQLAESESLAGEIHAVVAEYGGRIGDFALDRPSLPRAVIDLHRVFVIPRALYNGWALDLITSRLQRRPEIAALKGGPALTSYFCFELLSAIDRALVASSPSVRRPLQATPEWSIVGLNARLVWSIPFRQGPDWRGHYFIYETPRDRLTRARRKQLAACIESLDAGISEFSRLTKSAILAERHGIHL